MFYLAQVITYTGLMYLIYLLFLRNSNLHGFNRFYLLANIVLPIIIPFIKIPYSVYQNAPAVSVLQMRLPEYVVSSNAQSATNDLSTILYIVYACVTSVLLALTFYRWSKLNGIIRKHKKADKADHTLVYDTGYGPGSWLRYILLPEGDVNDAIIRHELVHVRLRHSIDIIMATAVQVLCWPNLFLLLIKRELMQVHEFQADAGVDADADSYSQLLVASAFGTCTLPLTHSFIIHPIKRRIIMLRKNKNRTPLYLGVAASIAALFIVFNLISLQSCKNKTWEVDDKEKVITEQVLKFAEQMPEFDGNIGIFLGANIHYPEYAKAHEIEGRVNVQFVVGSDGRLRDIKTVGKVPPDTGLARAAIDAVSKMPKWKPGVQDGKHVAVVFTLPVSFKLK